jgi:hypothetical protein
MLQDAEITVEEQKSLIAAGEKNSANLTEQVNKLENKSLLNKILIPVSFIVGGYLGIQIAK